MVLIASLTSFHEHEGEVSRYEAFLDQFDELMSNRDIASIATIVVSTRMTVLKRNANGKVFRPCPVFQKYDCLI
jgi:hypothetical protein